MKKQTKNNRGFTLLEVMMTVALLGILFTIIYGFLNFNLSFLNQRNKEQNSYQQARLAMYKVTSKLKQYENLSYLDPHVVKGDGTEVIDITEMTKNIQEIKEAKFELDGSVISIVIKVDPDFNLTTKVRTSRYYNP